MAEQGSVRSVLGAPRHPYTAALLRSMPRIDDAPDAPLVAIAGPAAEPARCPRAALTRAASARRIVAARSGRRLRRCAAARWPTSRAAGEAASRATRCLALRGLGVRFPVRDRLFGPRAQLRALEGIDLELRAC
ncbi:MAG: hypothetical protein U1F11_12950 [Steroidobacteraceae bacterium]